MPFEAYIGYISEKEAEAESGEPVVLEVRDMDTYERKVVRAVIAKPGTELADSDVLWILDWVEARQEDPWRIRVVEELEETDVANLRSDISDADLTAEANRSELYGSGRGRGGAMPEMMGQEEARKFFENIQKHKLGQKK